jgi:hypothetical protein
VGRAVEVGVDVMVAVGVWVIVGVMVAWVKVIGVGAAVCGKVEVGRVVGVARRGVAVAGGLRVGVARGGSGVDVGTATVFVGLGGGRGAEHSCENV